MFFHDPDAALDLDALDRIPVPESAHWITDPARSTWQPVQHGVLARTILREADAMGLTVRHHAWTTARDGLELFGSVDLDVPVGEGTSLSIGVLHSNAGRRAVTLAIGARVLICENGMLVGEHVLSHRHTCGLDLGRLVREGLDACLQEQNTVRRFRARLMRRSLHEGAVAFLLIEAARQGAVAWSRLARVDEGWRVPPHRAFRDRNAWSL